MEWIKSNLVSALAVLISMATLTLTGVSDSAATTSNIQTRLEVMEKQMLVLPSLSKRTSQLETSTAVTNQILSDLKGAVEELSSNTKELTKVVTIVAVLDEKVETLERDRDKKDDR